MGTLVTNSLWGQARAGGKALVLKYVNESECLISPVIQNGQLESIHIEFHGTCSKIPSMKNSKMPGKQFMNPDFLARLKAMDMLFQRQAFELRQNFSFQDAKVIALLICGKRGRSFDPLNCADTISDWLEPNTKQVGRQKKARGWGCGLINNDSQLTLLPIHSSQAGYESEHSTIIIRRWEKMKEATTKFVTEFFLMPLERRA